MNLDDLEGLSEEEVLRLYENMNGQTITGDGPGRAPQPNLQAPSNEEIASNQPKPREPREETTGYKFEPDRPRFGPWENVAMEAGINPKTQQSFEDDDIQSLLKRLEDAQETDRGHTSHDRRAAYALNAGEAMSAGFANRPGKYMDVPKHEDESANAKDYINSSNMLNNSKKNWKNKEQDRETKELINELKIERDRQKQASDQEFKYDQNGLTRDQRQKIAEMQEFGRDNRNKENNVVKVGVAQMGASAANGRGVAREAADAEYNQAPMQYKETFNGKKYKARGTVTSHQSNHVDKRFESYSMLKPALDKAADLLEADPQAYKLWGSDVRRELMSAFQAAAEANVKFQGDGVMNGRDLENAMRQLGNPETAEQFITNNSGAALKQMANTIDQQLDSSTRSLGYDIAKDGDHAPTLDEVHGRAGGAAGHATSSTGGDPAAGQSVLDAAGIKTPVPLKPARDPASALGNNNPQPPGEAPRNPGKLKKVIRNGKLIMVRE